MEVVNLLPSSLPSLYVLDYKMLLIIDHYHQFSNSFFVKEEDVYIKYIHGKNKRQKDAQWVRHLLSKPGSPGLSPEPMYRWKEGTNSTAVCPLQCTSRHA